MSGGEKKTSPRPKPEILYRETGFRGTVWEILFSEKNLPDSSTYLRVGGEWRMDGKRTEGSKWEGEFGWKVEVGWKVRSGMESSDEIRYAYQELRHRMEGHVFITFVSTDYRLSSRVQGASIVWLLPADLFRRIRTIASTWTASCITNSTRMGHNSSGPFTRCRRCRESSSPSRRYLSKWLTKDLCAMEISASVYAARLENEPNPGLSESRKPHPNLTLHEYFYLV